MGRFKTLLDRLKTDELSAINAIVAACLLAAALTALATAVSPKPQPQVRQNVPVPVYFPAERAVEPDAPQPLTTSESSDYTAPVILEVPQSQPVSQLKKSGPAFISLLGDNRIGALFELTKTNGIRDFYGGRWAPENFLGTANGTKLVVKKEQNPDVPFSIAEAVTRRSYGYGRYEAVLQPSRGSGLVTAFFTYTGPHAGDPHDEVDIEFLGKDPSKVHFNYWHRGQKGAYATFDLPFDASEDPHLYTFEWLPNRITWYVDGVPYYWTEENDPQIPVTAGRLFFSHWTGIPRMRAWHGNQTFQSGTATTISCVSFTPAGDDSRSCRDVFRPNHTGNFGRR